LKNTHTQKTTPVSQLFRQQELGNRNYTNFSKNLLGGLSFTVALSFATLGSPALASISSTSNLANSNGLWSKPLASSSIVHSQLEPKVVVPSQNQKIINKYLSSSSLILALKERQSRDPIAVSDTTTHSRESITLISTAISIPVEMPSQEKINSPLTNPSVLSNGQKKIFENTNNSANVLSYQVQKGDSLALIAARYGINPEKIIKFNQISNSGIIEVGQVLLIPRSNTIIPAQNIVASTSLSQKDLSEDRQDGYSQKIADIYTSKLKSEIASVPQTITVIPIGEPSDTTRAERATLSGNNLPSSNLISTASSDPNQDTGSIPIPVDEPNNFPSLNNLPTGIPLGNLPPFKGYAWPAKGMLTSGFGPRWGRMHKGIDIASSVGTPVAAAAGGEVISAGWNSGGYGNLVILKHADGSVTFYAHNSRILVHAGEVVQQGQEISEMGSTGHSTGPHLHFEVHYNGTDPVNPIAYLPNRA
jgi:murein DD-endopeptidase MepM/ murein hydrolase activator NlpD